MGSRLSVRGLPLLIVALGLFAGAAFAEEPGGAGEEPGVEGVGTSTQTPEQKPVDPWEGFNRRIFTFNEYFDRYLMKPAARGYRKATPQWLDNGITRFFENMRDLRSGLNNVLQWEWRRAGNNLGRFGVNTTLGVAGFFDIASDVSLTKYPDDLSATLGKWGLPQGPYLVLPFLGPSSVRDAATLWPEDYMNPRHYIDHDPTRYSLAAVHALDYRADVLDLEKVIVGDRYTFLRDVWLQNRRQIGGAPLPPDDFGDDDFSGGSDTDEHW